MYAKQGRGTQFTNEKDRDAYLKTTIKELNATVAEKQSMISTQEDDLAAMRRQIENESAAIKDHENDIKKKHAIMSKISTQLLEKGGERNQHAEDRRERWRALEDVADKLAIEKESQVSRASTLSTRFLPNVCAPL